MVKRIKLSIIGDFNPKSETHLATNEAILHSKNLLQNYNNIFHYHLKFYFDDCH